MPFYTFACEQGHNQEFMLKMAELDNAKITCTECKEVMKQQFNMINKPLVVDMDLMFARKHSGKLK